ncbi:MAG TPA: efflux RND transporter periplasmic adaptor subunit [Chthoniobacterales bacterium]
MKKHLLLATAIALTFPLGAALAHEGHSHGPEGDDAVASGPITLSEATIRNLGVETVQVNLAPLQRSLRMAARIQGLPERQAKVSARAEGRVAEIFAKLGDRVTAGQQLLRFEPLIVGNPPVTLNAPISGFVVRQDATLGQVLTTETVLMEVADYAQVLARATTFESPDLSEIKVGQPAQVRVDVFGDQPFEGKVQRLDVALERNSGAFEVYVLLENPELKLRPNMQAAVSVGIGEAQDALAVPQRAVLGDLGNYFVFVETGEHVFERRAVVLGIRAGDQVEVLEGVLPGEKVVTQGNYQLQFATSAKPPAEEEHHDEAAHLPAHRHAPPWLWAGGGFALGALLIAVLLRRSPA